jgi:hypothetical protein
MLDGKLIMYEESSALETGTATADDVYITGIF